MKNKQLMANCLLITAAFIWGVSFVAQKLSIGHVGPYTFNAFRFIIGAITMIPIMLFYKPKSADKDSTANVSLKKSLIPGALVGLALCAGATLQQIGIQSTTAGKASFITDLYIILIPIAELMFGRKISKVIWPCAALAIIGLFLISVSEDFTVAFGDILVFIGSFFWTAQMLLMDRFAKKYNPIKICFVQYLVTGLISFIIAFATENITSSGVMAAAGPILYTGIMSVGVAFTLQAIGQRYSKPSTAGIICSMESVFGALSGVIVLHEAMSGRTLTGCLLMIIAMVLIQILPSVVSKLTLRKQKA